MSIQRHHKDIPAEPKNTIEFTLHIAWGIVLVPVLILLLSWITKGVLRDQFRMIDQQVTDFLRQFSSPALTKIATLITHLATSYVIALIMLFAAGWLIFKERLYKHAIMLLTACLGSYLLNEGMKAIFRRVRPDWEHWVHATGYSFPSGHAMVSCASYGMLAYLLYRICRARQLPTWYIAPVVILLIVTIGLSRVYLGVHYITDVTAGFLAGGVWLLACIYSLSWMCRPPRR